MERSPARTVTVPGVVVLLALAATTWSPGTSAAVADSGRAAAPLRSASLDGDHPEAGSATASDASARVRLVLRADEERVCYRVRITGMTTRAVYVLRRSTDEITTRLYDEAPTDADRLAGCVTEVPAAVLEGYAEHPRRFYVQASSYDGADEIAGTLRRPPTGG